MIFVFRILNAACASAGCARSAEGAGAAQLYWPEFIECQPVAELAAGSSRRPTREVVIRFLLQKNLFVVPQENASKNLRLFL